MRGGKQGKPTQRRHGNWQLTNRQRIAPPKEKEEITQSLDWLGMPLLEFVQLSRSRCSVSLPFFFFASLPLLCCLTEDSAAVCAVNLGSPF